MKSRVAEALDTLRKICAPDPEIELQQMLDAIHVDTLAQKEPLFQKRYFMPILLAIHIAVFNQRWGINAVLYYLNDIFVSAGFSRLSVSLIFTLVAMVLIDRLGRKTLLLIRCAGMTVALGTIAYVFHGGHARRAARLRSGLDCFLRHLVRCTGVGLCQRDIPHEGTHERLGLQDDRSSAAIRSVQVNMCAQKGVLT